MSFAELRRPSSITERLVFNTLTHTSPLSRTEHSLRLPGERWSFTFTYQNLKRDEAEALNAYVQSIGGMAGRFEMPIFWQPNLGIPSMSGNFVIPIFNSSYSNEARNPGDTTVLLDFNLTDGAEKFQAGRFFSVNGELKKATAIEYSFQNVTDFIITTIAPPLRTGYALTSVAHEFRTAVIEQPTAFFRLTSDSSGITYRSGGGVNDMSVEMVEVI